jgi:peptidoglycan/xylan/chitin deacetylase (PgdA/CDA1 family)
MLKFQVRFLLLTCLISSILLLNACNHAQGSSLATTTVTSTEETTPTSAPPTATQTVPPTSTVTITPLPPTPTITNTPTPKLVYNEAGQIVAPILLYHHVEGQEFNNRYTVSIPDFRVQMEALSEMGYTTISLSLFLDALVDGAELPEKPILISFDDGHRSVYENAFPIMKEFNFTGVFYIVANRLGGVENFVDVKELNEMMDAGWDVGSHGFSHIDLTLAHDSVAKEIGESKSRLSNALSTQILTFAYPFGTIDPFLAQKVNDYGYRAGMGLGTNIIHTWRNLFYLERIEIYGNYSLEEFKSRISTN